MTAHKLGCKKLVHFEIEHEVGRDIVVPPWGVFLHHSLAKRSRGTSNGGCEVHAAKHTKKAIICYYKESSESSFSLGWLSVQIFFNASIRSSRSSIRSLAIVFFKAEEKAK